MKSMGGVFAYLSAAARERNLRVVAWLVGVLVVLVAVYAGLFHVIMEREGRDHSIATGVYWTLTTMSTLGFGDITFNSDLGRVFSVIVLLSGALFILVLLPFAFIQFVFLPWMSWREHNRAPSDLPEDTEGHILLTGGGEIANALIKRASDAGVPCFIIEPDRPTALAMYDEGYKVMVGEVDSPETYRRARVDKAAMVATMRSDTANTNIAFTVREISETVRIVTTAASEASVDVLELAGADEVIQLGKLLGQAVARRVLDRDGRSEVIGRFDELHIAEARVIHPDLVGKTLRDADIRARCSVNVVGIWERGSYHAAGPDRVLEEGDVLILAGSVEQLAAYDAAYGNEETTASPVLVIGAGRVGRAAGKDLEAAGIPYKIIEKNTERIRGLQYVVGDAADIEVLERAGLRESSAVIITTHDDDVNVYLTLYCRRLEPEIQIISRANLERNVATLHRAGADAVLSYASLGASAIWNTLGPHDVLVLAEGLVVFRTPIPKSLFDKSLIDSQLRQKTGCTVVAIGYDDDLDTNPDPTMPLPAGADLVIIADEVSEKRYYDKYPNEL